MDVIELTRRLVAIDSVNPALVPGGAGEPEIARFVVAWAEENGLAAEVLEATPGRPSVVVRKREARGRTLMLCAHLDTVGVEGMSDPHAPRIAGDRLYGRGAYDMKSGLAAALIACREADGDVLVAAVADEEHASLGVQEVLAAHTADAAIVTEPTEGALIVAHKGFVWIELEIEGRAAHGSRYEEGVDAIVKAGPVLTAIGELDAKLAEHSHPRLGRGSVHASLIEGGAELSSYPARCTIGLERRTLPGETDAQVEAEIAALSRGAQQRTLLVREPFEVDPEAEIVRAVAEAAGGPELAGAPYWADAAFIAAAGIPTVMYGAGGAGAHAAEEWVSVADTIAVTETLVAAARRICG
jgi:acetylornithine deacetylase